jgi:hypothetical protein
MGLTIVLEDENGGAIQTLPKELDHDELENIHLDDFILLKYIDFYGNTTFNTLQLDDLISDLEKLKPMAASQSEIIQQIISLAKRSQDEVHTYIKFYGD